MPGALPEGGVCPRCRDMVQEPRLSITYWGTTGTFPAPLRPEAVTDKLVRAIKLLLEQGRLAHLPAESDLEAMVRCCVEESLPFHLRSSYGGNTTCVEVQTGDGLFILDCGSGLRELGAELLNRWQAPQYAGGRSAHILISHPHMDHTWAIPHIPVFFDARNHFTMHASAEVLRSIDALLAPDSPLSAIYFPLTQNQLQGIKARREVVPGETYAVGTTQIQTYPLHHPGGCVAYRIDYAGRSYVFATDHEQLQTPDPGLALFARGADVLYTEGQYLQSEYDGQQAVPGDLAQSRHGWGHSSVEACVVTAVAAGVRQLHLGHQEPRRSDEGVAEVEARMQTLLRETLRRAGQPHDACRAIIPYEGLTVCL